jgi:acetyltransferase-like isoleucine patch superfamily enzyme
MPSEKEMMLSGQPYNAAGSVVIKDVPDDTAVVGNPAKAVILKYQKR